MDSFNTEMKYKEEANTFSLQATLSEDKISFTLKDYIDLIIYERTYTEEDIGKEIHKKMDLQDLSSVFSLVNLVEDAEIQRQAAQTEQLKNYCFGKVMESSNGSYKIQRNGVVTICVNMFYQKDKKKVSFKSVLYLKKVGNLKQMDIFRTTQSLQKEETNDEIFKELKVAKNQNLELKDIITKLKEIVTKLQNKHNEDIGKLEYKIKEITQKLENKQNKGVAELKSELNDITIKLENEQKKANEELESKLSNAIGRLQIEQRQVAYALQKQMNQINKKLDNQIKITKELENNLKEIILKSKKNKKRKTHQRYNSWPKQKQTLVTFNNKLSKNRNIKKTIF